MSGPEILIPITLFVSVAAVLILRGPLGKAIADGIRRAPPWSDHPLPSADVDRLAQEVDELKRAFAELDEVRQRLAELEERQDFAERLLAQRRSGALGPGA